MSIEIGSKWVKDGEVVEVKDSRFNECFVAGETYVWFLHSTKTDCLHILTEHDFLEQYKPYKVVYEYEYILQYTDGSRGETSHMTEDELKLRLTSDIEFYQRLDFTKRERKCGY